MRYPIGFFAAVVCALIPGTVFAQAPLAQTSLALSQSRYSLRAGEPARLQGAAETIDFLRTSVTRRVAVRGGSSSGFVVGPNIAGDGVLLAASLTTPPGVYTLDIAATGARGEQRSATVEVTLSPSTPVPSNATQPPVILLNGWQFSLSSSCPISSGSSDTFGTLATQLTAAGVPVVYFFDNCVEDPGGAIEDLGTVLGKVINLIDYSNGTPVPKVDLIAHSMGGLIVRAYLSGLQKDGTFATPQNTRVRKFIPIATPHFGSFLAANYAALLPGVQAQEMVPGSSFLFNLSTWNQRGDDLRGVDALAIAGNAGPWTSGGASIPNAGDGVVSLSSASLGFASGVGSSRTRILNYCHTSPSILVNCSGTAIAPAPETAQIAISFLTNTTAWQSIGSTPNVDPNLSQYGGLFFADAGASGGLLTDLSAATFAGTSLNGGEAKNEVYYSEFAKGTGSFQATSASTGSVSCGPFTAPIGYFNTTRCKSGPAISGVGPLLTSVAGVVVNTSGNITISGSGFGQTQCGSCQVQAYPGPVTLTPASWSDTAITAALPASFTGLTQVTVTAAAGQDSINFMANASAQDTFTIQTVPEGLQFTLDGGAPQTAPQTLSLIPGAHTIAVAATQGGTAGTQYVFSGWSDGGGAAHTFLVAGSGTLTANFQTQYLLTLSVFPQGAGTVTPSANGFYNAGSVVNLAASVNKGYAFTDWTGPVANASLPSTTVTMNAPESITANFAANGSFINPGGVVPLFSSVNTIEPGSWISIYGSNIVPTSATWTGDFSTSTSLAGVSVTINNRPAYISSVTKGVPPNPDQINLEAPDDSATGVVPVIVSSSFGTVSSSVTLASFAPSFSLLDNKHLAALILTPNGTGAYGNGAYDILGPVGAFSYTTRPVNAGETLVLYGVGFGPTTSAVPAGVFFAGAAKAANPITITIGGVTVPAANIGFAGISYTGQYQFNITVPQGIPSGDQAIVATVGGVQSPAGFVVTIH